MSHPKQAIADLREVAASGPGRRLIERIMADCGVWTLSYSSDPLAMAFAEGRRAAGNQLMADVMEHAPDAFLAIIQERLNRLREAEHAPDAS